MTEHNLPTAHSCTVTVIKRAASEIWVPSGKQRAHGKTRLHPGKSGIVNEGHRQGCIILLNIDIKPCGDVIGCVMKSVGDAC